jgi:hypothetical protein
MDNCQEGWPVWDGLSHWKGCDGEILETLWSGMDEIAGLTQAMSISHCQEVQDDYMNDSNWGKIIRMGRNLHYTHHPTQLTWCPADSLCGKWSRAKDGVSDMRPAFEQLTDCLDPPLSETEVEHGNLSGSVSSVMESLAIEKSQSVAFLYLNNLYWRQIVECCFKAMWHRLAAHAQLHRRMNSLIDGAS